MTSVPTASSALPNRQLGRAGPHVSLIGLGCMGMSEFYGVRDDARNRETIRRALDRGITFFDTSDVYGPFTNEEFLGGALAGLRDRIVLATKCGIVRDPADPRKRGVDNTPDYIRACCDASLRRLRTDVIDLYYLHRHNPDSASIEDAVGAMAGLVRAGKVRHLGLSEVSAGTLRRAHAMHPITAVQSEYSLWSREPEENGVLATCRELGVGFVPYSPLGRGFLSGAITRFDDLPADDARRDLPRFQGENFKRNLELVRTLKQLAAARGATASQLALAWVLAQGGDIVPIPGTTRVAHLDELIAGAQLTLTRKELAAVDHAFPPNAAVGERYYPTMRRYLDR